MNVHVSYMRCSVCAGFAFVGTHEGDVCRRYDCEGRYERSYNATARLPVPRPVTLKALNEASDLTPLETFLAKLADGKVAGYALFYVSDRGAHSLAVDLPKTGDLCAAAVLLNDMAQESMREITKRIPEGE